MLFHRAQRFVMTAVISLLLAGCSTPAAPTPSTSVATSPTPHATLAATSALVSATSGGTLTTSDGRLTLRFPPGAVATDLNVTARPVPQNEQPDLGQAAGPLGAAWSFEPDGTQFAKPVAVSYVLSAADLAQVNFSEGFPTLGLISTSHNVTAALDDVKFRVDPNAKTMNVTANTTHFSQIYAASGVEVTFAPKFVASFVDGPAWRVAMTFRSGQNDKNAHIQVTAIGYQAEAPILGGPGVGTHPDITLAPGVSANLADVPPAFDCLRTGTGIYYVGFVVVRTYGTSTIAMPATVSGLATCIPHVTMNATLAPPTTTYRVGPAEITDDKDWVYSWNGAVSCGVFTGSRTSSTPSATWTHPNAPAGGIDGNPDSNGDGISDYCPHSEQPNFSHSGTITVDLYRRSVMLASCVYSGSLSGEGECHAAASPL